MHIVEQMILGLLLAFSPAALAHDHPVKHGMVLVGTHEVFASHIVGNAPHNYQVLVQLKFDDATMQAYAAARVESPVDPLILILDPLDIAAIAQANRLTGTIVGERPDGTRRVVVDGVSLDREHFQVLFFDELPLSLASAARLAAPAIGEACGRCPPGYMCSSDGCGHARCTVIF